MVSWDRVSFLFFVLLITKKSARPLAGQWKLIGITGILDAAGNLFFSMATHLGRLDISAVLGSLYPAATVFLAWFFLKERLGRKQWVGVSWCLCCHDSHLSIVLLRNTYFKDLFILFFFAQSESFIDLI
ncbi:MAG: EamA family transporter [Desulfamplus sp.]|nr:EamA family transporter [Desulfamplus sp.]